MGLNSPIFGDVAATPGRRTVVRFDLPETVLVEPFWSEDRSAEDIHPGDFAGVGSSYGVEQLASGWWGLMPLNTALAEQHETIDDATVGILSLSDFNHIPEMTTRPTWRKPTDQLGLLTGAAADLKTEGDNFFRVDRPAGSDWSTGAVMTALVPPPVPESLATHVAEEHILLDRVADGITTYDPDTGWMLRWNVSGNPFSKADWALRFYFGGALTEEGLGAFCLLLGGNGDAVLYEREDDLAADPPETKWVERARWQFSNASHTFQTAYQMRIIPHCGRHIEFKSGTTTRVFPILGLGGAKFVDRPTHQDAFVYQIPEAHRKKRAPEQGWVTGEGPARFDKRRDLDIEWQLSRLTYPISGGGGPAGKIVDGAMNFPFGLQEGASGGPVQTLTLDGVRFQSALTAGPPLTISPGIRLFNAETGDELAREGDPDVGDYKLPGGKNLLIPVLEFDNSDNVHSPYLSSYTVSRDEVTATLTPGEFSGGILQSMSITGPESDPTHETARFHLQDPNGSLPRLAVRSFLPVEVRVEFDGDPANYSILHRGYARSPKRTPMQRDELVYPNQDWSEYEIECIGMWRRLQSSLILQIENYAVEKELYEATGERRPWKVTDVIKAQLKHSGFLESQIDVPDFGMRLWATGPGGPQEEAWRPATGTSRLEYIRRLAADYLGGYLLWDPNAGTAGGMWRVKFQPVAGTVLWHFLVDSLPGVQPRLAHSLRSYPPNTSPIMRIEGQPPLHYWTEPPEGNAVLAMTMGDVFVSQGLRQQARKWSVNTHAVDWPAFGTHADPDHPDYMGFFDPIIVVDTPSVSQGGASAAWIARRVHNFAARARPMAAWVSHLAFVEDPTDPMLPAGKKRPLRYGDSCLVGDDLYLIRSVSADYDRPGGGDAFQWAHYEAQKWIPPD